MNKKQTLYIILLIVSVALIAFFNAFVMKKEKTVIDIDSSIKIKVDTFIRNRLLANISDKKTPEKYTNLNDETILFFSKLQTGTELIEKNQNREAWQAWDYCLKDTGCANYKAETYLIIGTSLGGRDAKTSLVLLQKALEITRSSVDDNRVMEYCCLNEIVRLLVSQAENVLLNQDTDKMAMCYSLEAHQILSDSTFKYKEHDSSTSIYRIAAESLYWLGEDSLANLYVDKLLSRKQIYDHPEFTRSYVNILYGLKAYINKDYNAAECYFKEAISTIGTLTSYLNFDLELPYAYLGSIYMKQKRFTEAIDYMEKSIKTLQSDYYKNIEEPLKQNAPDVMKGKKNTYNIILCYLRLQHYYKKAINANGTSVKQDQLIKLSTYTNQLIKSWFLNAADEETLLQASKLIKKSNANAVDVIFANKNKFDNVEDRIFQLETEASSFYLNYLIELRKQKKNANKSKSQYNEIRELTLELMSIEATSKRFMDEFVQKKILLLKLKSELWDENREELEQLVYNQCLPKNLDSNEAVIKFFMSYTDLYITYYTANGRGIKKSKKLNISSKLKQFKHAVKSGMTAKEEQRFFYNLLFKPLQQELQDVSQLTILSDEMLEGITFELLMNAKEELLVDNYAIKYAYSAKNFQKEPIPHIENILALAPGFEENKALGKESFIRSDIVRTGSCVHSNQQIKLAPISCSIDEVEEIGKLFKGKGLKSTVYTSKKATKTNLIKHILNKNIVHISTHGISKNEFESGLFFTNRDNKSEDGFLRLSEVYQMDFDADLVVLSACKTGIGEIEEGEGVMALPRGFIYAGVPNVIASLWKVHDVKTKDLMVAFYTHLLEDKVSYAEALQLAKLDCIKKGFLPLDWAGFVLIGN